MFQAELELTRKFLSQYRLNTYVAEGTDLLLSDIDLGMRQFWGLENEENNKLKHILDQLDPNTIYRVSDDFFCHYILLLLPERSVPTYFIIGPFTEENHEKTALLHAIEKHNVPPEIAKRILEYYANVPYLSESSAVHQMLDAFAETIWNGRDQYKITHIVSKELSDFIGDVPSNIIENITEQKDISFHMEMLEKRYAAENRFIKNISQGNYHKVESALSNSTLFDIENRVADPVRNFKNYGIVLHTLLRKGAELGAVHPIHIDKLSSHYAKKMEEISSLDMGKKLMQEMIRKYCLLVKNHSLKDYSLLVQKVITRIDADLNADQTLNMHAELLNVNPSYLSTLFRKETGQTLTEYVNRKRIDYGVFLLNTTNLQIQTIADHCGIGDINYFTRIFKKYIGTTPKEYRKSLGK